MRRSKKKRYVYRIFFSSIISLLLCSFSKPNNLILLASCWAFFLRRQALEASLFFSFRDLGRTVTGNSLTGVMSLMILPSLSSSFPILCSFFGLGVRSLPSPLRALPLNSKNNYNFIFSMISANCTCVLFPWHCSWGWKLGQWPHWGSEDLPVWFSGPIAVLWAPWPGHCTARSNVPFSSPSDDHLFQGFLLLHHWCLQQNIICLVWDSEKQNLNLTSVWRKVVIVIAVILRVETFVVRQLVRSGAEYSTRSERRSGASLDQRACGE